MEHTFWSVELRPPLEQMVVGKLLPAHLMVCRRCYQVEVHAFNVGRDKVNVSVTIANPGNGACEEN